MDCASCGAANRSDARFCGECGLVLTQRCPTCGRDCTAGLKFCDGCGADVRGRAVVRETRKVVTVVFADLAGSTSLHERLDAESVRRIMERYYDVLRSVVEAHDGTVVKLMGDGVMAAFGVPNVREDDAVRAVHSAVAMQAAFGTLSRELESQVGALGLRVAINSGEVVVREDDRDIVGDPVNVAARLQQEAGEGEVVIGEPTRRLVHMHVTLELLGEVPLKGRSETVRAYRVVSLDRPNTARATTFVGRDDELARLLHRYQIAVDGNRAELAVVLGSPGLGKSRLVSEVVDRIGENAAVLTVSCTPGGATFAPVADALRALTGMGDRASAEETTAAIEGLIAADAADAADRGRIVDGISALVAGAPRSPEETFFVVRRLLEILGRKHPVVVVLDDLHWAEPLLLDLAEHLVEWSSEVALLVLVAARPELRDVRSALATPGRLVGDVITLDGLDAGAAARLAADVVGTDQLPAGLAGHVLATSEGNPLFLGELVRMLVDDGAVRQEGNRWVAGVDLAKLELPPTIHALLSARIERLRPEERTVLERAAVVGRHFSRGAVAELLTGELQLDLDAQLESLRRAELIEPDPTWFLGEPMLRFHHVLIREAAYQRLLKETRAELHVRFADWLVVRAADANEHDETLGLHLEAAHQFRDELGASGAEQAALGERAARHLAAAGRRALARDDVAAASGLLGRAVPRLSESDPQRADLALDWCEALLGAGDVDHAVAALGELSRWTEASPRLRAWHACFVGQRAVLTDPQGLRATAEAMNGAAAELAAAGDDSGEAKASFVRALALSRLGEFGPAETALDRALVAARRADDWRRANAVLAGAPVAALWGPNPVTRASGRCLDVVRVLRITAGSPAVEAVALRCQAVLEALRGRAGAARKMLASSRRSVEELGLAHRILEVDMFAGIVEMLDGDFAAAERSLRIAYDGLRELGLGTDAAQAAALLARALLGLDRVDEAEALSHDSEALAGDGLQAAIAWRGARAEALARRGEHALALDLACAAVELAAGTDALLDHADARLALAAALRAAGRGSEADEETTRAIELWEAKGATALLERSRGSVAVTAAVDAPVRNDPVDAPVGSRLASGAAPVFDNAAVRARDQSVRCFEARDWDGLVALYAPDILHDDRRALIRVQVRGEAYLVHLRIMFNTHPHRRSELLATRGDRLALFRDAFAAVDRHGGDADFEMLSLSELGATGRTVALVTFDTDDVEAAYDELDARFVAGEGAAHAELFAGLRAFREPAAAGDRDALATLLPDDFTMTSHRLIGGTGSTMDRDEYIAMQGYAEDLAVEGRLRLNHLLRISDHAFAAIVTYYGTMDGGAFESTFVSVNTYDGRTLRSIELFDLPDLDAALARFAELDRRDPLSVPANSASRARDRIDHLRAGGEWDALRAMAAPGFSFEDRRSGNHLAGGIDLWIASNQELASAIDLHGTRELLASFGDRVALQRVTWHGGPAGSRFEIVLLSLAEVDATGRLVAIVAFDAADRAAADTEMFERFAASDESDARRDGSLEAFRAWQSHDLDAFRARMHPGLTSHDHRHTGVGVIEDRDAYLEFTAALWELSEDATSQPLFFVATHAAGSLHVAHTTGTVDGGEYESVFLRILMFDGGLLSHVELFEPDDFDVAVARFDELCRDPDELIPPNAATRGCAHMHAVFEARDLEALRALTTADFRWTDNTHHAQIEGDVELYIASNSQLARDGNLTVTAERVATWGDRIQLEHLRLRGGTDAAPYEVETLRVTEVDADGLVRGVVLFDVPDRGAAFGEGQRRFFAGEAAPYAETTAPLDAMGRAFRAHDWAAFRATLSAHFEFRDHRRLGIIAATQTGDEWAASQQPLAELAPDVSGEYFRTLALDHHGRLAIVRMFGTQLDGGEFENLFVAVTIVGSGRIQRHELFEIEDLDQAFARFEELRPDSTPLVPPNVATRMSERVEELRRHHDWRALRALAADGFVYEDRRPGKHHVGGVDMFIESDRFVMGRADLCIERELLVTAGDRIRLEHIVFRAERADDFQIELLSLLEIDAAGRLAAVIAFDPGDRRAAYVETQTRFIAGEGAEYAAALAPFRAFSEATTARDWAAARWVLSDDFEAVDHGSLSLWGTQDADDFIASLQVLDDVASETGAEACRTVAWDHHGRVVVLRRDGTVQDGGPFESVTVVLETTRDGRMTRHEMFDIEDLDRALARFAELRPA